MMTEKEAEAFLRQLIDEGLVKEKERYVWGTLRPERLKRMYDVLNRRTRYLTILLEAVDDGHNQAAVLRTAEAMGIQDVYVVTGKAPFEPNKNVTQSAHKWLNIWRKPDFATAFQDLKQKGYQILVSHLSEASVPLPEIDLSKPTCLVFGNEHSGVSEEAANMADGTFIIPMQGFVQSFNISVAAAITLYDVTQRARAIAKDQYFLTPEEKREILDQWILKSVSASLREMALEKRSAANR